MDIRDIHGTVLKTIEGSSLKGANLRWADLRWADLRWADLQMANLQGADLRWADLQGADLQMANLQGADLQGANLKEAKLSAFQIPQEGELTVWKKVKGGLVKLLIPADAQRTASLVGRKCRASKAIVLEGAGTSRYDKGFQYIPDTTVYPDSYDPDIRVECTNGVHFFLTREEAEEYI